MSLSVIKTFRKLVRNARHMYDNYTNVSNNSPVPMCQSYSKIRISIIPNQPLLLVFCVTNSVLLFCALIEFLLSIKTISF